MTIISLTNFVLDGNGVPVLNIVPFTQRISYNASNLPEYLGYAEIGNKTTTAAVWLIMKLNYTGNNVSLIEHTTATPMMFNKKWSERTTNYF